MSAIANRISSWMGPQAEGALQRSGLTPSKIGRKVFDFFTSFIQDDVNSYFTKIFAKFKPKNSSKNINFSEGNLPGLKAVPTHHSKMGFLAWDPNFYRNFMFPRFFGYPTSKSSKV